MEENVPVPSPIPDMPVPVDAPTSEAVPSGSTPDVAEHPAGPLKIKIGHVEDRILICVGDEKGFTVAVNAEEGLKLAASIRQHCNKVLGVYGSPDRFCGGKKPVIVRQKHERKAARRIKREQEKQEGPK